MNETIYFRKLDTLRFIAFFLVFWQHAFSQSFNNISSNEFIQSLINKLTITGGIGVHVFFVLSGFLITFLMIMEENNNGSISLGKFYLRRILRIWPVYYLIIILGIFILPTLFSTFEFNGSLWKNLLFMNNFDMLDQAPNVGIAWSVAIEEQFYLIWPILFILFKNKKNLFTVCLVLIIASITFKINNPSDSYFHTIGNILYLMIGCIGAIGYSKYKFKIESFKSSQPKALTPLILISIIFIILPGLNYFFNIASMVILPVFYLLIILNLVINNKTKRSGLMSKWGKYTYGMYFYHPMIIIFVKILFDVTNFDYQVNPFYNFLMACVSLIVTIIISTMSYNYFEKHILKLKSKFAIVKTRI